MAAGETLAIYAATAGGGKAAAGICEEATAAYGGIQAGGASRTQTQSLFRIAGRQRTICRWHPQNGSRRTAGR